MTNRSWSGNQTRTLVLQKHVQSQTPPEQAANRPTPSQPVSIYTRQQAEIPMSPSVTFTEPRTSAGINPNDCLWFETNDVHIVQSVHSFLGSHVSQKIEPNL